MRERGREGGERQELLVRIPLSLSLSLSLSLNVPVKGIIHWTHRANYAQTQTHTNKQAHTQPHTHEHTHTHTHTHMQAAHTHTHTHLRLSNVRPVGAPHARKCEGPSNSKAHHPFTSAMSSTPPSPPPSPPSIPPASPPSDILSAPVSLPVLVPPCPRRTIMSIKYPDAGQRNSSMTCSPEVRTSVSLL